MPSFPQTGFELYKDDNYIYVSTDWTEKFIRSYGQDTIFVPWQVRKDEDPGTLPKAIIYDMVDYFAGAQWSCADISGYYIDITYKKHTHTVNGVHITFLKFPFRWSAGRTRSVDDVIDEMRPKTKVTKPAITQPTYVKYSDGSYVTVNWSGAVDFLNAINPFGNTTRNPESTQNNASTQTQNQ